MAATSLFNFAGRCPASADLPDVPAIGDFSLIADCTIPSPLQFVFICPTFDLPPPVPVVNRALYITITAGPTDAAYSWDEAVPTGNGSYTAGARSGTIANSTGAYEINGTVIAPGARAYPATILGGTGKCTFIAGLPISPIPIGGTIFVRLTSYDPGSGSYAWGQVTPTSPTTWAPTGVTGSPAAGTAAYPQNGVPAPPDGTTVYAATPQPGGTTATATASISGTGIVTDAVVTNAGSGYTVAPNVALTGGGGTGATATAALTGDGVSVVTVTAPGSGYTSAPTVAIDAPPTTLVVAATNVGSAVVAPTPSGGIPRAASLAPGSATVEVYFLSTATGLLTDSGIAVTMYNIDTLDAVAGNAYVQGKLMLGGAIVHDYEICSA